MEIEQVPYNKTVLTHRPSVRKLIAFFSFRFDMDWYIYSLGYYHSACGDEADAENEAHDEKLCIRKHMHWHDSDYSEGEDKDEEKMSTQALSFKLCSTVFKQNRLLFRGVFVVFLICLLFVFR